MQKSWHISFKLENSDTVHTSVLTLILEFIVSGPHNFQMNSIILQNSKFKGPVDCVKNLKWEPCFSSLQFLMLKISIMP